MCIKLVSDFEKKSLWVNHAGKYPEPELQLSQLPQFLHEAHNGKAKTPGEAVLEELNPNHPDMKKTFKELHPWGISKNWVCYVGTRAEKSGKSPLHLLFTCHIFILKP